MDLQFVFLSLNESDIIARQLIGVVEGAQVIARSWNSLRKV